MTAAEWVMSGGFLAIIAMVFHNNRDNSSKVRRVYQRLDETKDRGDKNYVSKDVCVVQNRALNDKINKLDKTQDSMDEKMDKLLLKNGIS